MISVAVLDYDCGNVRSITNALLKIQARPVLTRDPALIQAAGALVIPGVGAFKNAMETLHHYGLVDEIHRFVDSGKMVLGICLGMQMLFEKSYEFGESQGLGLIEGVVEKMPRQEDVRVRLPHISWNRIYEAPGQCWEDTILSDTQVNSKVYFVHSYAARPANVENVMSLTTHGEHEFVSSVKRGNVFGCQFHPEKSRDVGLGILKQFIKQAEGNKNDSSCNFSERTGTSILRFAGAGKVL